MLQRDVANVQLLINHNAEAKRTLLAPTGSLTLRSTWLSEHQLWLTHLRNSLRWEQRELILFGKRVMQPRLISWFGDNAYTYSRDTLKPRPFPSEVQRLLDCVSQQCRHPFNHVLLNYYEDGHHSMGFHADDEPELGRNPAIASLSLGANRTFTIKPKAGNKGARHRILLGAGDLLLMSGAVQHHYVHGLPKSKTVDQPRLNLTFRNILK